MSHPSSVSSITEIAGALRLGRVTATGLVEQCLSAIADRDPALNAFIAVLAAEARAQARDADAALAAGRSSSPLCGIPLSVKDVFDLERHPTTAASRARATHRAASDAPVMTRLRSAGAVFIGKCNLHEFAFGTTGEDSAFGPTRNPHAVDRIPGGSSSGSAVSVATGMALASIGSDTGGSIRIPAAACGVVGLKPTFGELECQGVVPLARSLDHVGPLTLTVSDAALVYQAMLGVTTASPGSGVPASRVATPARLGIPRRYFFDIVDPQIRERFDATVGRLRSAGCAVADVDIAHAADIGEVYRHTQLREAYAYHAPMLDTHGHLYSPTVRSRLEMGRDVSASDYARAQALRETLRAEVDEVLAEHDVLLLPTLPIRPPPLGTERVTVGLVSESVRALTLRLTQLFDLTGHPAISVPCGTDAGGLPMGVQLVGRRDGTQALLDLAMAHESSIRGV